MAQAADSLRLDDLYDFACALFAQVIDQRDSYQMIADRLRVDVFSRLPLYIQERIVFDTSPFGLRYLDAIYENNPVNINELGGYWQISGFTSLDDFNVSLEGNLDDCLQRLLNAAPQAVNKPLLRTILAAVREWDFEKIRSVLQDESLRRYGRLYDAMCASIKSNAFRNLGLALTVASDPLPRISEDGSILGMMVDILGHYLSFEECTTNIDDILNGLGHVVLAYDGSRDWNVHLLPYIQSWLPVLEQLQRTCNEQPPPAVDFMTLIDWVLARLSKSIADNTPLAAEGCVHIIRLLEDAEQKEFTDIDYTQWIPPIVYRLDAETQQKDRALSSLRWMVFFGKLVDEVQANDSISFLRWKDIVKLQISNGIQTQGHFDTRWVEVLRYVYRREGMVVNYMEWDQLFVDRLARGGPEWNADILGHWISSYFRRELQANRRRVEYENELDQYYPTRCRLINLTLERLLDVLNNSIDTPTFYLNKHVVLLMDVVQLMKDLRDHSGQPFVFNSSTSWDNQLRDIIYKGLTQTDDPYFTSELCVSMIKLADGIAAYHESPSYIRDAVHRARLTLEDLGMDDK